MAIQAVAKKNCLDGTAGTVPQSPSRPLPPLLPGRRRHTVSRSSSRPLPPLSLLPGKTTSPMAREREDASDARSRPPRPRQQNNRVASTLLSNNQNDASEARSHPPAHDNRTTELLRRSSAQPKRRRGCKTRSSRGRPWSSPRSKERFRARNTPPQDISHPLSAALT